MRIKLLAVVALATATGCKKEKAPEPVYQAVPVEHRDIVVSARANGAIQPDTTVEVKSKASGEILSMKVETGSVVSRGTLLIQVDPRTANNAVNQAMADLEVAKARLANALSQKNRSDTLYASKAVTETEHEQAVLDYANAKAVVVGAEVALENAKIRQEDTDVRAPITGTIIAKNVERGQVISSPTSDVGGGTVLLTMADLNLVQVRTLVDETDIGKIQPGLRATVTVDAYPNRPFEGIVLKIEPQAETSQNVTMFPVLVRIQNQEGLLKPGMNADVEIHVGRRDGVLAVPVNALRTQRDVSSAADVLGISMETVQQQLAAAAEAPKANGDTSVKVAPASAKGGNTMTMPDGRTINLPEGVTEAQVRAIFAKRMGGGEISADERALLRKIFQGMGGGGGPGGRNGARPGNAGGQDSRFAGRYIVFVRRNGETRAVNITTGLSDLDYSEVTSGLTEADSVVLLPSASLVNAQKEAATRIQRMTGGGGIPGMSSGNSSSGARPAAPAAPR
ncbi:MAG TPA: efflux RND transporter periplasmic adaptor subunit [Gemmatimonadales bacterium]|nr:efflux RND transporter periplasmic adaptor subunit [Gemmatimonadales bacterium]